MSPNPHNPAPQARVQVDKTPTPEQEAAVFETPDERLQSRQYQHELDLRGWIGSITGSSNTPLNLAAVMVAGLFVLLLLCIGKGMYSGFPEVATLIERLLSALLAVGAFIFGVNQGPREK